MLIFVHPRYGVAGHYTPITQNILNRAAGNLGLLPQYPYPICSKQGFLTNTGEGLRFPDGREAVLFLAIDETKDPPEESLLFHSGRRESNPALMLPKHIYYRYTTPR